jgi:hypothetical protein
VHKPFFQSPSALDSCHDIQIVLPFADAFLAFSAEKRLSEWPKCFIRNALAALFGAKRVFPVWRMMQLYGDRTFAEMLKASKCERCGGSPAPVSLCASAHRQWSTPEKHFIVSFP